MFNRVFCYQFRKDKFRNLACFAQKSLVGQLQLKKGCSGTILTAIGDDEFKRIILPDIPVSIQSDIKKKITEMYNAKALSNRLLNIAKQGVEIAIEKDEKEAQDWIGMELKKYSQFVYC